MVGAIETSQSDSLLKLQELNIKMTKCHEILYEILKESSFKSHEKLQKELFLQMG